LVTQRELNVTHNLKKVKYKMVTPLRFFRTDPNKKGRGQGVYYRRTTKGGTIIYSKYDIERDKKIKAKGWKASRVGLPGKSRIRHTGDGKLPR